MAPELIRRTRQLLPNLKLAQVYGLSATGFFTGLQDQEHTEDRFTSCGKPCPGIDLQVLDESGKQIEVVAKCREYPFVECVLPVGNCAGFDWFPSPCG
jgi:acyl-coenzyme A synthetase/AMP-(fatty) acid ligase